MSVFRPLEIRLEEKTIRHEGLCWEWTAYVDEEDGYGRIGLHGKAIKAHRASFLVHRGEIPDGLHVLHSCDNPPCTNPDHLRLGTHEDNMADKKRRGRSSVEPGESPPKSKLTSSEVLDIRKKYGYGGCTYGNLAAEFGVSKATIGQIVRRVTWRHL